jgi:hypothetical protein
MPARNSAEYVSSQAAWIQRLVPFGGRLTQEILQAGPPPRIIEQTVPCLVLLAGEKEAREVRDLRLFILRQNLADFDDFLGDTHARRLYPMIEERTADVFNYCNQSQQSVLPIDDHGHNLTGGGFALSVYSPRLDLSQQP